MFNYATYTGLPDSLTFEEANDIYKAICTVEAQNDSDFQELWRDVVETAAKYVTDRNHWGFMTSLERADFDHRRTLDHNSYMSTLTALGRYCTQHWTAAWPEQLGTPEHDRKRIGDFAAYILLFNSLQSR
ncbi:hypothetical protein [uncultured Lacticaseibacillus sp.]|uniref:hypothetical protein n=1 Tax=uncultured Lacticaseibacillus sp. TaxID=2775882 RepID=UPI0025950E3F|nr:hypothetical protein [uncultured Lacticaseibacillus sp.]